jgi:cell division protein FtsQ
MRVTRLRDPAPSRLAYRLHRLALSPLVRRSLFFGLPIGLLALAVSVWLGDAERREMILGWAADFRRQVEQRPEFMVQVLAIDGASDALSSDIRESLRLRLPVSSFDLDLEGLRAKVAAFDPVAGAQIYVRPGGVLHVEVQERVPVAIQRRPDGLVTIDAGGHVVRPLAARVDRPDLPLIAGTGAGRAVTEALVLVGAAEPLAERLAGLVRVGERRWDVVLSGGQRIMLPEQGAADALDQAIALDRAQEMLARDVVLVDLRNPRRPTLRMSEGAASSLHDITVERAGSR